MDPLTLSAVVDSLAGYAVAELELAKTYADGTPSQGKAEDRAEEALKACRAGVAKLARIVSADAERPAFLNTSA